MPAQASARIPYRLLLLTRKCLHALALQYLSELLREHTPSWNLWSLKMGLVSIPHTSVD